MCLDEEAVWHAKTKVYRFSGVLSKLSSNETFSSILNIKKMHLVRFLHDLKNQKVPLVNNKNVEFKN